VSAVYTYIALYIMHVKLVYKVFRKIKQHWFLSAKCYSKTVWCNENNKKGNK